MLNKPPFNLIRITSACCESANAKCPILTTHYKPFYHEEAVTKQGTKLTFSNRISATKKYREGKFSYTYYSKRTADFTLEIQVYQAATDGERLYPHLVPGGVSGIKRQGDYQLVVWPLSP